MIGLRLGLARFEALFRRSDSTYRYTEHAKNRLIDSRIRKPKTKGRVRVRVRASGRGGVSGGGKIFQMALTLP